MYVNSPILPITCSVSCGRTGADGPGAGSSQEGGRSWSCVSRLLICVTFAHLSHVCSFVSHVFVFSNLRSGSSAAAAVAFPGYTLVLSSDEAGSCTYLFFIYIDTVEDRKRAIRLESQICINLGMKS
jgi:hypothetical protein